MEQLNFAQAVARVRVFETHLLDRTFMERVIDSKNLENAIKLLQDKGYSSRMTSLTDPGAFEEALNGILEDNYRELDQLSPEPNVMSLIGLKYDYHHIKVCIKSPKSTNSSNELMLQMGTLSPEKIKRDLLMEDLRDFPEAMRTGIERVLVKKAQSKDPFWIDVLLDKAYFEQIIEGVRVFNSPMIETFFQQKIDVVNLLTLMRCQSKNKGKERFSEAWINGGTLDRDMGFRALNEPIDNLIQKIAHTQYAPIVKRCVDVSRGTALMLCVEKHCDELILEELTAAKRISFGPEPLFAFWIAKDTEIQNLRLILLGLQSHLEPEKIRERLRKLYV